MRKDWMLVSSAKQKILEINMASVPNKEKISMLPLQNFMNPSPQQIYEKCRHPLIGSWGTADMILNKVMHCKTGRDVKLI